MKYLITREKTYQIMPQRAVLYWRDKLTLVQFDKAIVSHRDSTLISLISVEVGINVEGVPKLPNHLKTWRLE